VEFGDPEHGPKRVTILMLEARLPNDGQATLALDGTPIRPHSPMIEFDQNDLIDSDPSLAVRLRWFFERKKISFRIRQEKGAKNDFHVVQGLKEIYGTEPGGERDFNWGVHVKDIIDNSEEFGIDPGFLSDVGSKGKVVAKVVLDTYGELSSYDLDRKTIFYIADTLNGDLEDAPLSEQTALEFNDTKSVTLVAYDLDDKVGPVEFTFDTSAVTEETGPVDVLIGNFCCDNLMPRFDGDSPTVQVQRSDEDFRWYYEMFDDDAKGRIIEDLSGLSLPIPIPVRTESGTGLKPVQCMRLSLHAQGEKL
jgi:hypothetical protein